MGQVTSGKRYWNDGTPVAGQQFEYGFDDFGNRTSIKSGGDALGQNLRSATHFVCYDGNGNVTALAKATDGSQSAGYEYGPFGEVIRASGTMAKSNPFRFSTKYQDDESELLYYGYRFYNASTGRWPSRDPIQEAGGISPYAFVLNGPLSLFDPFDLKGTAEITEVQYKWHGSLEPTSNPGINPYCDTGDVTDWTVLGGTFVATCTKPGVRITGHLSKTKTSVTSYISAGTVGANLPKNEPHHSMSAGFDLKMKVCATKCCDRIRAT